MQRIRSLTLLALLAALGFGAVGLSACTDSPSTEVEVSPSTTPTPNFDPDETLWTIATTGEQLSLEDSDVQALQKVVALHSGVSDNRSPATVEGSVTAEVSFFTPSFRQELEGEQYADAVVAMYADNDLTIEQTGVAWMQSTIDPDRQHATVGFESIFRIVDASEGYLHEFDVDAGAELAQPREYSLTKIDGAWWIENISKGPARSTEKLSR